MKSLLQMELPLGDPIKKRAKKQYKNWLTADVNEKGVLDVDTVKGCFAGMAARPGSGCYGGCYAANIANFRGFDFSKSVTRLVHSKAQARAIEKKVASAPNGFFRIGVMGDPCHAWEETVSVVEWLCEFAVPVIITKHWRILTDNQIERLIRCGTSLNTSISALDTAAELKHRKAQFFRFKLAGGNSVARIVSCEFNSENEEGAKMKATQAELFRLLPTIDNPLRASNSHPLVKTGVIILSKVKDISSERTISLENKETYVGHCAGCADVCGLKKKTGIYTSPTKRQLDL
jgi:hypothetical protein